MQHMSSSQVRKVPEETTQEVRVIDVDTVRLLRAAFTQGIISEQEQRQLAKKPSDLSAYHEAKFRLWLDKL